MAPGVCLLSRGAFPRGSGAAVRSVDRFQKKVFGCGAELPALAPGARCPSGRSVWSGAPQAVQWTAKLRHARNISDPSRVLEQGPDRQRAPGCCSGGVSSINGASESRCSHDGPAQRSQQGQQPIRHRSSPGAAGFHEGGFMAQGQAPWAVLAGSPGPGGCCARAARVWWHQQRRPWRC